MKDFEIVTPPTATAPAASPTVLSIHSVIGGTAVYQECLTI